MMMMVMMVILLSNPGLMRYEIDEKESFLAFFPFLFLLLFACHEIWNEEYCCCF